MAVNKLIRIRSNLIIYYIYMLCVKLTKCKYMLLISILFQQMTMIIAI